jgi:hypothetical protein
MARPIGPSANKPFRDALKLTVADNRNNPRKLRYLAEKLYDMAKGGCVQSMALLFDRLEGKAPQAHGQDADLGALTVRWLEPVDAAIRNSAESTGNSHDGEPERRTDSPNITEH